MLELTEFHHLYQTKTPQETNYAGYIAYAAYVINALKFYELYDYLLANFPKNAEQAHNFVNEWQQKNSEETNNRLVVIDSWIGYLNTRLKNMPNPPETNLSSPPIQIRYFILEKLTLYLTLRDILSTAIKNPPQYAPFNLNHFDKGTVKWMRRYFPSLPPIKAAVQYNTIQKYTSIFTTTTKHTAIQTCDTLNKQIAPS